MITAVTGATGATTTTAAERSRLGKNEFLTLLVTQLRNQDPLSPLQPHEFAAQLAQFTSVEQLTQLNEGMARQSEAIDFNSLLGKTGFAASLIGRQIVAEGNQVAVGTSGTASVRVEVGGTGGRGTLIVRDSNGRQVASRDVGTLGPGRHTLELPTGLAAGTYTYELKVTGANDAAIAVTPYTVGVVDAVYFKNGAIVLRIGGMEIPLDAVAEIETPPATPATPPAAVDPTLTPAAEPPAGDRRRGTP